MSLYSINSDSFTASLDKLKQDIMQRQVSLKHKYYIVVPDSVTLRCEQLLFDDDATGGAFDVEVVSLNRLFSRFVKKSGYLSRLSAVMLLKKIIRDEKDRLTCFKSAAGLKGFAESMYEILDMISASRLGTDELLSNNVGALGLKLKDIALIKSRFDEAVKGMFVDANGRTELLLAELKSRDLSGCSFYFAGQDTFTKLERELLEMLSQRAAAVRVYSSLPPSATFVNVKSAEFFTAPDTASQLKKAAKIIRAAVVNGERYRDMCIISPSIRYLQTERILTEFSIPFYADKKFETSSSAPVMFLKTLFRLKSKGKKRGDFILLSKNFYSALKPEEADIFENVCLKYSVDYKGFDEPFTRFLSGGDPKNGFGKDDARIQKENERIVTAESVRKKLTGILNRFMSAAEKVDSAESFYEFIKNFFGSKEIGAAASNLALLADEPLSDVYLKINDRIVAAAKEIGTLFNDGAYGLDELTDIFFEGLEADRLSVLPPKSDVIKIGKPSEFKYRRFKRVFVIDFNEGEMPPSFSDRAIISDRDIDEMDSAGVTLEPKSADISRRELNDFIHTLEGATHIFFGSTLSGESRPSEYSVTLVKSLAAAGASVRNTSLESDGEFLLSAFTFGDLSRNMEKVAAHCSSRENALEMLLYSRSDSKKGVGGLPFEKELYECSRKSEPERYLFYNEPNDEYIKNVPGLYFPKGGATISKVQEYFRCPYANFLSSGLKLRPRDDGTLSPLELGTFLHLVAEKFVAGNDFDNIRETAEKLIETNLTPGLRALIDTSKGFYGRIAAETVSVLEIIASQLGTGSFRVAALEEEFPGGKNLRLGTLYGSGESGNIFIRGTIDRIDVAKSRDGRKFARVIDYKTGGRYSTALDVSELYTGRKLQLFIYMKILENAGFEPAGIFYFPFSTSFGDDDFSHRLSGVYVLDPEIMIAMDRELLSPGHKSAVINARRKLSGGGDPADADFYAAKQAVSLERFKALTEYALLCFSGAAEEILGGYIAKKPIDGACGYCDYKAVCRSANTNVRKVFKADAEFIAESVENFRQKEDRQ